MPSTLTPADVTLLTEPCERKHLWVWLLLNLTKFVWNLYGGDPNLLTSGDKVCEHQLWRVNLRASFSVAKQSSNKDFE